MKLNEKWTLFLIATFVTFFGIVNTLLKGTAASEVPANEAFDDINFYKCVVDAYNTYHGTSISYTTSLTDRQLGSSKLYYVSCGGGNKADSEKIVSIKGVEKLTSLTYLGVNANKLTEIDVSKNTKLTTLDVGYNKLTKLDVSQNTALVALYATSNQLTNLDLSKNTALTNLSVGRNKLTKLDLSKNTKLIVLSAGSWNNSGDYNNQLTSLDLSKNIVLEELDVSSNLLTNIDLSKNTSLKKLRVNNNQLTSLNVINNTKLTFLNAGSNKLTSVNVNKNTLLTDLYVGDNQLTSLNVINNTALTTLRVSSNLLTDIDVSKNTKLTTLDADYNQLTKLDVSKNTVLYDLNVRNNKLTSLDISKNTSLKYLYIYDNLFGNTYNLYKNSTCTVEKKIIFPSQLDDANSNWSVYSSSIATVDSNGLVTAKNSGTTYVTRTHSKNFTYSHIINVFEITSDKYIIDDTNGYVLVFDKDATTIKSNIDVTEGGEVEVDLTNNMIYVKSDNTVLKEFKLIIATSSKYDLTSDYIYLGNNILSLDDVKVVNGTITVNNNKLYIKYGSNVLKELKLLNINFNTYEVFNNNIKISNKVVYEDFVENITVSEGVTYKLFNDNKVVTSGNILSGMVLKVYYNGKEIDEYVITEEYVEFDNSINVNDGVINKIKDNTMVNDILDKINTNGEITVLDKDGNIIENTDNKFKTGDKIKIKLSTKTLIYKISVRGDTTGDGVIDKNDMIQMSKHFIKGNVINGDEYLKASDVDNDGKIGINDIIKLAKHVVSGSEL